MYNFDTEMSTNEAKNSYKKTLTQNNVPRLERYELNLMLGFGMPCKLPNHL